MAETRKGLRCAIYTRKSTEEGLDQNFNSLEAQREAGEAYIVSQRQSGWTAVERRYDDGGFSGATLERPALQQLLADVSAGRVDCVVVYKVDRLSRSLLDFARLMSVFDERGVSFVSVTQEFNTTTSLGRLTLNILLSFAQFEREIISERTRDKLGAARRKGKWIGGIPILGYDVDPAGGRLLVNAAEAARVREIFSVAAHAGSLQPTLEEIQRRGITTKIWTSRKGRLHAGKPFSKSTLRALLGNVLYIGSIRHKGTVYAGEQPAIVERELWEEVNRQLEIRSRNQVGRAHGRSQTLLAGLLYCGQCGSSMAVRATRNHGRRYHYYGCQKTGGLGCAQQPVAVADLEEALLRQVGAGLSGSASAEEIRQALTRVSYDSSRRQVTAELREGSRLEFRLQEPNRRGSRCGQRVDRGEGRLPRISRLLALAIKLERLVSGGELRDYAEIARLGQVSRARLSQILSLLNLSPAIQETLLFLPPVFAGRERLTEKQLRQIAQEIDWQEQEKQFSRLQPEEPCRRM